jgi:hypothetical protein
LGSYHRAGLNVRSIIALNDTRHFRAVVMLGRNSFELAVEIRPIDVVPDAIQKMVTFERLEKLKATEFASTHKLEFPTDFAPYHQNWSSLSYARERRVMRTWKSGSGRGLELR